MLSRLTCTKTFITPALLKSAIQNVPRRQVLRTFAEESKFRSRSERISEKMSLKERAMAPPGKIHKSLKRSKQLNMLTFRSKCFCDGKGSTCWWKRFGYWCALLLRTRTRFRHQHSSELTVKFKISHYFHHNDEIFSAYGHSMSSNGFKILICTLELALESVLLVLSPFFVHQLC